MAACPRPGTSGRSRSPVVGRPSDRPAAEYLNSLATVFVDGKQRARSDFPGGELDLTAICQPGSKHVISLLVVAAPLKAVMLSYTDTAAARQVKGTVPRRGLCGDVFLVGNSRRCPDRRREGRYVGPPGADLAARRHCRFSAPAGTTPFGPRSRGTAATVTAFTSKAFTAADLDGGRITFTAELQAGTALGPAHAGQTCIL